MALYGVNVTAPTKKVYTRVPVSPYSTNQTIIYTPKKSSTYTPAPTPATTYTPKTTSGSSKSSGGTTSGGTTSGGTTSGGTTSKSSVSYPTYTVPKIKLNIPTFAWNPTAAEKAGWLSDAERQAALIVDPQKAAEIEALERYKGEIQSQIGEVNPRMTQMSLAIANQVQNTIKQDIINELIRRGATTSGEMERQLAGAGRYEVEQRTEIENQRNALINALMKQQEERERESGTRLGEIEKIRGLETTTRATALEQQAKQDLFARQQAQFEAQLAKAQLQNAAAAAQYDAEYKKALFEADLAQSAWQRQYSEQQLALQQQQQAYQQRASTGGTALNKYIPVNVNGQTVYMTTNEYLNWLEYQNASAGTAALNKWLGLQ